MNGYFIKPSQTVTFDLYVYVADKDGIEVYADSDLERLKSNPRVAPSADQIQQEKVTFRFPKYKDNVDVLTVMADTVDNSTIQAVAVQYARMVRLLQAWTFKDGDEVREVNQDNIDSLHPSIASAIIVKMTSILTL